MHTFICTKQNEHQLQNAKGRKSETANTFVTHERKFIADLVVGFAGWGVGGGVGSYMVQSELSWKLKKIIIDCTRYRSIHPLYIVFKSHS